LANFKGKIVGQFLRWENWEKLNGENGEIPLFELERSFVIQD